MKGIGGKVDGVNGGGAVRKGMFFISAMLFLYIGAAWGATAVPVSPGDPSGTAITDQVCPTFSWSLADGAVSYRIEVYEQSTTELFSYETINSISKPVSVHEILAPALSWTPSSVECLSRGLRYVWYVRGVDGEGKGQWSEGRGFQVETSALSIEQKDAVEEVIKKYLTKEAVNSIASSTNVSSGVTDTAAPETPPASGSTTKDGVRTAQAATSAGVQINDNLGVSGNILLPQTTASTGIIYSGASRLMHSYGTANFFAGVNAGSFSVTSFDNTGIGPSALSSITGGGYNTAVGAVALVANNSGERNTGIGCGALQSNTGGGSNTAVGNAALNANTGSNNTAVGTSALVSNTSGSGNTAIGYNADVAQNNLTNATAIGANATVGQSNSLVLGGTGGNAVNVGIGTTTPTERLEVNGNIRAQGVVRMGSENGTAEIPDSGIIVRRAVSQAANNGRVVARTGVLQLQRDGTNGGFKIVATAHGAISCMGVTSTGANANVNLTLESGTTQVYTDGQNLVFINCSFGDPLDGGPETQVALHRESDDWWWYGTITSSYNQ